MTAAPAALPLEGLVVAELTGNVAGAWCGRQFAALGADVWKFEDPDSGDFTRSLAPCVDPDDALETGIPWLYLNEGKRSAAVRTGDERGLRVLTDLLSRADVLLTSLRPVDAAPLGLNREALAARYPRLVVTSLTPYGMTGPKRDYRGVELTEYAASGLMHLTGEPEREPLQVGIPMAEFAAGQAAVATTMAGLLRRDRLGRGVYADIAIVEVGAVLLDFQMAFYVGRGYLAGRLGNLNDKGYPWGIFPCRDGYAAILAGPPERWPQAAAITGIPELAEPRFATAQSRQDHRDEMEALLLPWLLEHDKKEIFEAGQATGLAWGYVRDASEVAECPQLDAEGFFGSNPHPRAGDMATAALPFTLGESETLVRPAPLLGQHTRSLLEDVIGMDEGEVRALEAERIVRLGSEA